jgi:hypothetical protein
VEYPVRDAQQQGRFVDYVLWGDDGLWRLELSEQKMAGKRQANCGQCLLEQMKGQRPLISLPTAKPGSGTTEPSARAGAGFTRR